MAHPLLMPRDIWRTELLRSYHRACFFPASEILHQNINLVFALR